MNLQTDKPILTEDEKKISYIYETYEKSMHEQAIKILNNSHEADMVVQESLSKIVRYLNLFDLSVIKNRRSSHFFMTIVKHTAINYCRKKIN